LKINQAKYGGVCLDHKILISFIIKFLNDYFLLNLETSRGGKAVSEDGLAFISTIILLIFWGGFFKRKVMPN